MKLARIKFILILCFCWGTSYAQIGAGLGMDQRIYKTSHHSPEAAALGKYGEIPVSLHTGVPDISVPIYLIELPDLQIPISLNYHAGGIKVEEVASNVGLGWSLSYGGVINQVKNGMNDFTWNLGWLHTSEKVDSMMSLSDLFVNNGTVGALTPEFSYAIRSSLKHVDSEADLFSYSFPGQSGKFYFNQSAKYFFMPKNKNRLEFSQGGTSPVADNITITDEKGNRFIFSDIVSTTIVKHGGSQSNLSPGIAWAALTLDNNEYNYSYYLTQIITKNSDTVKYTYAPGGSIFRNQYTESRSKNITGGICPDLEGTITYTESFSGELRVTEITTSRGQKVQFTYDPTARRDLNGSNTSLKGIKVLSYDKTIKEFSLAHDYFNGTSTSTSPDDFRLKLLSVTESGKPAYKFKYNEGSVFPNRLSFSQDHWGYYNAASNTTLLPQNIAKGFLTGANREIAFWAAEIGVLEEIEYPTGGKTVFDYESNDCKVHDTSSIITSVTRRALSMPGEVVEVGITIPPGAYEIRAFWNAPNVTGTEYVRLVSPTTSYVLNCTASSPVNGVEHNIPPGNYTIQVYEEAPGNNNYYFRLMWNESQSVDTTYNKLVGGLRVKSIKSFSNKNDQTPAVSKFYSYKSFENPAFSSGLMGLLPKYEYTTESFNPNDGIGTLCPYLNQVASSVTPLGMFQGGSVAYDNIAVSEDSLGYNGLSRYYYRNSDYFKGFDVFPFSPMMFKDWKNGRVEQTVQSGKSASMAFNVAKSRNEYYTDEHDFSTNVLNILYGIEYIRVFEGEPAQYIVKFGLATYYHFSGESRIIKEEKIDFSSQSQQDSIVTVKRYYYDNASHPFPTRMETESSNKLLLTKVKYPLDYDTSAITNAADKGITLLARRNILIAPVETYAQIRKNGSNDSLTTAGVLNYYNPGRPLLDSIAILDIELPISSFVASSIVSGSLNKSVHYKTEAAVSLYDDKSNVLEQRFKNKSMTESLIWDYKQQYPVAQVQNAAYNDIAYTSFEAEGKGNWSFSGTVGADITAPTGGKVYNIQTGTISKSVSAGQTYIVSYWTTNATPYTITGTQSGYPIKLRSYNGWNYYEHKVSNVTNVSLSGSGYIDELRLCPLDAQMVTYTYDPHIGITSECSSAGKIQYYQYDALNRLYVIKDQFGKILKQYDYQYQVPITQ